VALRAQEDDRQHLIRWVWGKLCGGLWGKGRGVGEGGWEGGRGEGKGTTFLLLPCRVILGHPHRWLQGMAPGGHDNKQWATPFLAGTQCWVSHTSLVSPNNNSITQHRPEPLRCCFVVSLPPPQLFAAV
jgi:hypothetical protein